MTMLIRTLAAVVAGTVLATSAFAQLPYDHPVVALGASTNDRLIPGSSNALTFKTMAGALVLRIRVKRSCAGWATVACGPHRTIWANRRIESLTCRGVYQQQEAETEGGEQA
jgi:hypothetical protein